MYVIFFGCIVERVASMIITVDSESQITITSNLRLRSLLLSAMNKYCKKRHKNYIKP